MREKLNFLIKKHEKLLKYYEENKPQRDSCIGYSEIFDNAFSSGVISSEKNIIKDLKDLLEEK